MVVRFVALTEYAPVPLPEAIFVLLIVGFCVVAYTTPLSNTAELPSDVTLPPRVALFEVILEGAVVVTVGDCAVTSVLKLSIDPYEVPAVFVAYALT